MNKANTFFYVLKHTFTSVDYYQDILKAPFKFTLKFFYVYFFIFSVVFTGWLTFKYYLPFNQFLITFLPSEIMRIYPSELEVTIQDGAVSTNVVEPYFVPITAIDPIIDEFENQVLGTSTERANNILVIDTMADIKDFPQYETLALLTKHHLSVINEDGNIETIPLDHTENVVINQSQIREWVQVLSPYLNYVAPILIIMTFVGILLFLPLWNLIYALFLALLLQLFSNLMKRRLSFEKAWQLELHFLVISTTFFTLWQMIGVKITVPFLETVLVTILGLLVIKHLPKSSFKNTSVPKN